MSVIAYSGELDKQIQAARVMEEAFAAEGQTLSHRIGPGMGHKYHPDVLKELLQQLSETQKTPAHLSQAIVASNKTSSLQHARLVNRRWNANTVC